MVAVGDDFMATVRAMDMVRQLHNRAALVQVKRVGDQGSMLVRPAIQVAFHNVPCALHTNLIYIWVVPLSPHPSLHCFSWTSLVHTRSMHVAIISSTLQLRLGRCQEWKAVELPSVDKKISGQRCKLETTAHLHDRCDLQQYACKLQYRSIPAALGPPRCKQAEQDSS